MNKFLVSIIVPIYNVEKYLVECLDSLMRQTLKGIEVILINDGSTDNSKIIAEDYVNRNCNFKLINQMNGGLSAARNTGIEAATGEYLYFLDSDDFIADDAIEKLYIQAKKKNLDQLRFEAYRFDDGTKNYLYSGGTGKSEFKYSGLYEGVFKGSDFYQRTIDNGDYSPSCCLIFIKRSVINKYHIRFYEGILHEDNLFNFELTMLCDRVALLKEPLYYRRYRYGSITHTPNWLERTRSMCISAEETDKFIGKYMHIDNKIATWQINCYANMMLWQWEKMTKSEQESEEVKEYFSRVKELIWKYNKRICLSYKLFYLWHPVYRLFRWWMNLFSVVSQWRLIIFSVC